MMVTRAVALISIGVILLMHNVNGQEDDTTVTNQSNGISDVTVTAADKKAAASNETLDCAQLPIDCRNEAQDIADKLEIINNTFPINETGIVFLCIQLGTRAKECAISAYMCPPSAEWNRMMNDSIAELYKRCSLDITCDVKAANCRYPLIVQLSKPPSNQPDKEELCSAYNSALTCYYEKLEDFCFSKDYIDEFIKKGVNDLNSSTCHRHSSGATCKLVHACELSGYFLFPCDGIGDVLECIADLKSVPECPLVENQARFKDLAKVSIYACSASTENQRCIGDFTHCLKDSEFYQKNLQKKLGKSDEWIIDYSKYLLNSANWCSYMRILDKCKPSLTECSFKPSDNFNSSLSVDNLCSADSKDSAGTFPGNPMQLLVPFLLICWEKIAFY